jgi:diketogulonate reductase-like aldo/keto reductase
VAARKGCTAAQLALAWLITHEGVVTIPGSKHPSRVEENVLADQVRLSAAEIAEIEELAPVGVASGTRYPAASMRMINL